MASDRARMLELARSEPVWPRPPLWSMALGVALAAFLLVYPFLFTSPFAQHLLILILLYALMAQSWNVVAGFSGMISLGHVMFFGIGAYSASVLFVKYGISPWIGLIVGMVLSALAAIAVGVPTLPSARTLFRHRHAAHRRRRADRRAALGLGRRRLGALHPHRPHLAVAFPAIPHAARCPTTT